MEDTLIPLAAILALFIGLPWLVFHYITQWKRNAGLTGEDEKALDEMYEMSRRLDDRLATIERIIAADHPDYRLGRQAEQDLLDRAAPAFREPAAREPSRRESL